VLPVISKMFIKLLVISPFSFGCVFNITYSIFVPYVWFALVAVTVTRLLALVIFPDTAPVYGIVVPGLPVGLINI
jgi:hypothetical protein